MAPSFPVLDGDDGGKDGDCGGDGSDCDYDDYDDDDDEASNLMGWGRCHKDR